MPTTPNGLTYQDIVEGTGAWGAGLARHLTGHGVRVIEVQRPNRQFRRRHGKSDTADAIGAARAVQSGEACGQPKQSIFLRIPASDPGLRLGQRRHALQVVISHPPWPGDTLG